MKIHHVLKDGTKTDDITGHVVKVADAESVYCLITKINERRVVRCNSDNNARLEES